MKARISLFDLNIVTLFLVGLMCVGCSKSSTDSKNRNKLPTNPNLEKKSPPVERQDTGSLTKDTLPPKSTSDPTDSSTSVPTDSDVQQEGTPPLGATLSVVDSGKVVDSSQGSLGATPGVDTGGVDKGVVSGVDDKELTKLKLAGADPESLPPSKEAVSVPDRPQADDVSSKLVGSVLPPLENICSFPESLKKVLESHLKKNCSDISSDDLSQVETLTLKNIGSEDTKVLKGSYFRSLKELDLSNNLEMLSLPGFVLKLSGLKKLDISNTGIKNFGPEICEMQTLEVLKASDNIYQGNEMPLAIVCLSNLKELDLSYSNIKYIDEYIYYLKELETLNLRGNNLMITPVMLSLMPSLLILDLRENQFKYEPVNSLVDCSNQKTSSQKAECKEELSDLVKCEYWHELNPFEFQRGAMGNQSYRMRYTEVTGEEYKDRDECVDCAECYNSWINDYVFFGIPDDPKKDPELNSEVLKRKRQHLLDLTFNGKTIREWRLALDAIGMQNTDYWVCQYRAKGVSVRHHGIWDSMIHFMFPKKTAWAASSHEVHPERYRSPDWTRPEKCKPINFNTPLPAQEMGPWSKALPAVQALVEEKYLDSKWELCENWPTSICRDWEVRREKGEEHGGFFHRIWKREREDCNTECESYMKNIANNGNSCVDMNFDCEEFCDDTKVYLLETDSFSKQVEKSIARQCVRKPQEDSK